MAPSAVVRDGVMLINPDEEASGVSKSTVMIVDETAASHAVRSVNVLTTAACAGRTHNNKAIDRIVFFMLSITISLFYYIHILTRHYV